MVVLGHTTARVHAHTQAKPNTTVVVVRPVPRARPHPTSEPAGVQVDGFGPCAWQPFTSTPSPASIAVRKDALMRMATSQNVCFLKHADATLPPGVLLGEKTVQQREGREEQEEGLLWAASQESGVYRPIDGYVSGI